MRVGLPLLGVGLFVTGIVLLVIPGPGLPFVLVGGALLARESRGLALVLDWVEVKGRALTRPLVRAWQKHRAIGH